jgi:hypothetical protein
MKKLLWLFYLTYDARLFINAEWKVRFEFDNAAPIVEPSAALQS